jgi:hypothetical protein
MTHATPHHRLIDLPLWRLLVALDDAERVAGPNSSTARALVRVIREKLRREPAEPTPRQEVRRDQ